MGHDEREDYDDGLWLRRRDPAQMVHWPADLLGTFATLQLAVSLVGCVWLPSALVWNWIDPAFFNHDGPRWPEVALGTLAFAVGVAQNGLVFVGARRMANFQHYRLVVYSLIASLVPVVSCAPVSIPLGIWALIVVFNRDVRARFEAVARTKSAA